MTVRVVNATDYTVNFGDIHPYSVPAGAGSYVDIPITVAKGSTDLQTAITAGTITFNKALMTADEKAEMGVIKTVVTIASLLNGIATSVQHSLYDLIPGVEVAITVTPGPYSAVLRKAKDTEVEVYFIDVNNLAIKNVSGGTLALQVTIYPTD